jgi:autotransporter strand-loop-strand O-heptosyltransferase
MKIVHVTPGIIPIPPNGWGAVEKIIWETHLNLLKLGHDSRIEYLDSVPSDADVVHIHIANLALLAKERNIPYYFTMHDHHAYLYGKDSVVYKTNLEAMRGSVKSFVPAKYLVDYFEGIPEYFSHGVNTEYFSYEQRKEPVAHKLLCVANNGYAYDPTYDRKGFGVAIQAAERLNLPITIAGPSSNKRYFEKHPSTYDKLTTLYDMNEAELLKLYKEHTIFLHPSELEAGHPNLTLLEAMSCGLPIVGTLEEHNTLNGMRVVTADTDSVTVGIQAVIAQYGEYSNLARIQAESLDWYNRTQSYIDKLSTKQQSLKDIILTHYTSTTKSPKQKLISKPSIKVSNVVGMRAEINGGPQTEYKVRFIDRKTNSEVYSTVIGRNCWSEASARYYVDWRVEIEDVNSHFVYQYDLDLTNTRVYISLESSSLGDTLAWIPYVDEFRKKHKCKVICSTFWNSMLADQYTDIEFVKPGTTVNNLLAMYNIGLFYDDAGKINGTLHRNNPLSEPLQKWASDILGLEYKEILPKLNVPSIDNTKSKQVSIAIHSTAQAKYWNNPTGWQDVVNWLKSEGYTVKLLSKENDGYMGNSNPKGVEQLPPSSIESVIKELRKSELFIGLGSGLSWLSWAVGTPTMIISGFSDPISEPTSCIRIAAPNTACHGCFNRVKLDPSDWNWCPDHKNTPRQHECSKQITSETVINAIKKLLTPTNIPQEINGWFSYEDLYNKAVDTATGGETFVEVGAWLGKSTNHMIKKIRESGKSITFTTVDTWEGTINEPDHQEFKRAMGGELFPEFVKNLVERGHTEKVTLIKDTSKNAANHFSNNSIDYIMIDGDHSYDAVNSDLHTWFHKVKSGGIISGDDYRVFDGVTKAADEYFYGQIDHVNHSFVRRKPRIQIKHMLSRPTDLREIISVESIKQLQRYGFDYQQIHNGVYDGPVSKEFCRRPDAVNTTTDESQPGLGVLTSRHYGCYLAHVNAIKSIDDVQFDYTLIFEGDAFLSVGVEEFANMVYKSCFISERDNVYFIGLANNNSVSYEQIDSMFKKTAHNQDLAHAYLIPNRNKQWWLNRINDCEWDVGDLWLNHVFFKYPERRYATNKVYSIQAAGESLIDKSVKRWENGVMI